ncbi:MAG: DUF2817 domain-containing protein [Alkalibacterium sp.]|nr:DUF2817 domain-containing protein [Alkalibacterium sp.]
MADYRDPTPITPIEPDYDVSKVPSEIKRYADFTRTKKDGLATREAMARSAEIAGLISKEANDRSKELGDQFQEVIDETTGKDVISAPEIIAARNNEANLKTRLDKENQEVTAQLAQTEQEFNEKYPVSPSVVSAYWEAPTQPSARFGDQGAFASGFSITANQVINNLFEPMRNQNPNYITRLNKGKDESGEYDWWRYEFTPPQYEKTLILGAGLHGGETGSTLGLYLFLKELVDNWETSSQLSYLRNKVRLIVIPVQNPWGMSQDPKTRQNSRGVDLNRNFDYKWSAFPTQNPFDHEYKGTGAISEIETRYIVDTLEQYRDAIAYLDFHNIGADSANYVLYTPKLQNAPKAMYRQLIEHFRTPTQNIKWGEVDNPAGFIYAAERFGMHASNPEFGDGIWGDKYDSSEMTKYVEWYGNVIMQHAALTTQAKSEKLIQPFVNRAIYNHTAAPGIVFPAGANNVDTYQELQDLRMEFDVPSNGIVMVKGEITIAGNTLAENTQSFITPIVAQTPTEFSIDNKRNLFWEVYCEGMRRQTIPFSAEIPVYPTSRDIGKAVVGLFARTVSGSITVYRYRVSATFIPSDRGQTVTIFDATGRFGQGIGAMQRILPGDGRSSNI